MPVYTDNWPDVWEPYWGAPPAGPAPGDASFDPNFPIDFLSHTTVAQTPITERARWTFFTRDGNRQLTSQIADFQDAGIAIRAAQVGAWTLTLPRDDLSAELLVKPRAGIVVMRDDNIVFSGPVRSIERTLDKDRRTLTVSGPDDVGLLTDRLVKPEPQQATIPYGTNDYDARAGIASTVMYAYVANHAGGLATPERQVSGLVLAPDTHLGSNITVNGRWQTLDVVLTYCGATSRPELLYRCIETNNEQVMFQVYQSRDLSKSVVFSEAVGNLITYDLTFVPQGNHIVVGGSGSLRNRNIYEGDDPASQVDWGRIEIFDNEGSAQSLLDLQTALKAALLADADQWTINLELKDDAIANWGVTYDVGDTVTVIVDDRAWTDVIREVYVGFGKDGDGNDIANVTPFIETNKGREVRSGNKLKSAVRQVQNAVNKLEAIT